MQTLIQKELSKRRNLNFKSGKTYSRHKNTYRIKTKVRFKTTSKEENENFQKTEQEKPTSKTVTRTSCYRRPFFKHKLHAANLNDIAHNLDFINLYHGSHLLTIPLCLN